MYDIFLRGPGRFGTNNAQGAPPLEWRGLIRSNTGGLRKYFAVRGRGKQAGGRRGSLCWRSGRPKDRRHLEAGEMCFGWAEIHPQGPQITVDPGRVQSGKHGGENYECC
jgi:hypothetical protein